MIPQELVAQTLFCEACRNEAGGLVTAIGIYPDNINVEFAGDGQPILGALCLYSRVRLIARTGTFKPISLRFLSPSRQVVFAYTFESDFIEKAAADALEVGNEYFILIAQFEAKPFPILEEGRFTVEVDSDGSSYFGGAVRFGITRSKASE